MTRLILMGICHRPCQVLPYAADNFVEGKTRERTRERVSVVWLWPVAEGTTPGLLLPAVPGPPLPVRLWGLRPLRWAPGKPLLSRLQTLPYLGTDF